MTSIGLVGMGFVGTAVREGMRHAYEINWCDKFKADVSFEGCHRCWAYTKLVSMSNIIFVCVPTPMREDGTCDISSVEDVLTGLQAAAIEPEQCKPIIVIIKSTLPPGTTKRLARKYGSLYLAFNPEFLREVSAIEDFKKQDRIIIGGDDKLVLEDVKLMYQKAYPNTPIYKTDSATAEMVKYMSNCYLATKVAFANEIETICRKIDIDYDKVVEYATKDVRLGVSHWAVPGPDGMRGFGGSCFPKDLNGMITLAHSQGIIPRLLEAVWQTNLLVRPERDWEQLKGRAVSV